MQSIAPDDPDSGCLNDLGKSLKPALVLHEIAARSIKRWVIELSAKEGVNNFNSSIAESRCIASVAELRLKVIGGISGCYVINNSMGSGE
jgi:hypothetical protein